MKLELFDTFMVLDMEKSGHLPRCVIASEPVKNLSFEPTKLVSNDDREKLNFGFNKPID